MSDNPDGRSEELPPVSGHEGIEKGDPNPKIEGNISTIRTRIQATFGQMVLALTTAPRYRHQTVADLTHLVLEPLIRDRVAVALSKPKDEEAPQGPLAGFAIWASVSDDVNAKIQEQIKAGAFPVRLKPEDWTSGDTVWLLDVIVQNKQLATAVLKNFHHVVKKKHIRVHPHVARMVDPELLKQMGAKTTVAQEKSNTPPGKQ